MPGETVLNPASRERESRALADYVRLLHQWNPFASLVSAGDVSRIEERHLPDCTAAVEFLPWRGRHLDLGSGGGLPGIPIAIFRSDLDVVLLERNQRKCAFLFQVKLKLGLPNVAIVCKDAREYQPSDKFDTVTARAVAPAPEAWMLTRPLLKPSGKLLLHTSGAEGAAFDGGVVLETRPAGRGCLSVVGLGARKWPES